MLHAYLDESHDAKAERVFAVAGVFGSDEQWKQLEETPELGRAVCLG
jgi:hypothetical protein